VRSGGSTGGSAGGTEVQSTGRTRRRQTATAASDGDEAAADGHESEAEQGPDGRPAAGERQARRTRGRAGGHGRQRDQRGQLRGRRGSDGRRGGATWVLVVVGLSVVEVEVEGGADVVVVGPRAVDVVVAGVVVVVVGGAVVVDDVGTVVVGAVVVEVVGAGARSAVPWTASQAGRATRWARTVLDATTDRAGSGIEASVPKWAGAWTSATR